MLYNKDNVKGLIVFRLLVHSFRAAQTEHSYALEHACIIQLLRECQIPIFICVVYLGIQFLLIHISIEIVWVIFWEGREV